MPGLERGCSVCAVKSDRCLCRTVRGGGGGGGGEGGGGEEGGGRGGKEGGGEGGASAKPSSHTQPKSIGGGENFTAGCWGSFMGFTQRHPPPPPPRGWFGGVGVSGEGIKRWGNRGNPNRNL